MKPETGSIVDAAINKTPLLRRINKDRLAEVLKMKPIRLTDLRLGAINQVTLDRNIEGAYLKGLEALDNIKQPPQNNPASTFRDCIEAIYFYSPALALLGYKALAADLRGAALERLIDEEPYNTYAKKQHEISQRHFEAIKKPVLGLLGQEFGGIEAEVEYRLKTEGSIREKLATDTYANLSVVPDGVGFTFIVPDEMAGKETIELARHYMNRLTEAYPNVVAKHPVATEEAFEEVNKANGYQAIHLTFYYYPEDSTDPVPFEIQIQTQTVHEMKLYGSFSDLYYKLGTPFSPDDRAYHKHLAKRMKASREMEPSSTMASVAEMVSKMHEVPSVFNRIFQAIDLGDNGLTLVPAALGEVSQEIADQLVKALGEKEALAVLPAARVGILQFEEALGIFGKSFIKDRHIQDALAMVKSSEASSMRADGKTNVLEGHLLPVALSALMLAIQTGRVWDSELGANEYLSNIVTIAILHDYVETELEKPNNAEAIPLLRQSMLYDIRRRFGSTVMNGVAAMTLPMETKDPYTRREQYRRNIQNNEYARLIKPCDRWQNHITDLIKLATTDQAPKGSDEYRFIMRYFAKTDRHQSADFTAANMPAEYKRIHKVIWQIARHYGYEGET
jgi:(p)ppGpp synthase/HD superfamily hydrolase